MKEIREMCWQVELLTLFPEMFPGFLEYSLAGKALKEEKWTFKTHNLRQFGRGKHKAVDDTPFGGGAGMVIRADILDAALRATLPHDDRPIIYFSPRGRVLQQKDVLQLALGIGLYCICGRYEGIDDRIFQKYEIEEISIGDYILSGGEPAALVLMDACIRLLPGVMGSEISRDEESFSEGLLEYPHYTKPSNWQGYEVPEILLSGHHVAIAAWRQKQAERVTMKRRPDLWENYQRNSNLKNN